MKYSEYSAALPKEKRASDATWTQLIMRPLSLPLGFLMLRAGFSANGASFLGMILALAGCCLVAVPDLALSMTGVLLLALTSLLDCIDGNIARAKRQSGPDGEWIDAMLAYTVYAFLPIAVGIHSGLRETGNLDGLAITVGACASAFNIHARLAHQKYEVTHSTLPGSDASVGGKLTKKVDNELGLGGLMIPVLALAIIFGAEIWYLSFYAAVFLVVSLLFTGRRVLAVLWQ